MARRPGAAQAQDSDSELVKPSLSLSATRWREHRNTTEPRTRKPPHRGESRAVEVLVGPVIACEVVLGVHLNAIPVRREIAQGKRGVCQGVPAARAALCVYYLDQPVASIAGAEEQEPVRHGVPASVRYQVWETLTDSAPGRPASGTRISPLSC